jgi:hypothetical protein
MRKLLKQLFLFLMISGVLLTVTGCGGNKGGGESGGGTNDAEVKQEITARIDSFKTAVEAYDVEGMLGFLHNTGSNEQLIIADEGLDSYSKDYATLETELREDEGKQRHWRKSPPAGNGYTLTMKLGAIIFSDIKESGVIVVVPFEIIEAAEDPPIEATMTDHGHMTCEMVKIQGIWRCQKLVINFYDLAKSKRLSSAPMAIGNVARPARNMAKLTRGFSFGSFAFE